MSDVWRIFVVVGEEALNRNIVNSLRKDGYIVQSVLNGADAVQALWSEEYDVVLCDLKTAGVDGFELLQWLRATRPNTRVLLIGASDSDVLRMQALEAGAAGYLEKPLDLHTLKEELRRLMQQTGFSANLDSFDLLDVIQIISMSRKSIALLANTGLEERGLLCFKEGNLVWAEYGILRGEEAFFALAAHKNGTVTQQAWNEQVVANVTQPLSRLIFQALQYRTKYANQQPYSGEQLPVAGTRQLNEEPAFQNNLLLPQEEDDTPFGILADPLEFDVPAASLVRAQEESISEIDATREWWERTGAVAALNSESGIRDARASYNVNNANFNVTIDDPALAEGAVTPPAEYKAATNQRNDLPSWLTEQPTAAGMQAVRSSSLAGSGSGPLPVIRPSSPEWQTPKPINRDKPSSAQNIGMRPAPRLAKQITGNQQLKQATGTQEQLSSALPKLKIDTAVHRASSAEWRLPEPAVNYMAPEGDVLVPTLNGANRDAVLADQQEEKSIEGASQVAKGNYNYSALVSALQSLGYSLPGFIAAAVMNIEGQPIAQVSVDDLNIARICKHFSTMIKSTLQALDHGMWGDYEDTVVTSSDRHILIHMIGSDRSMFQVLITTLDAQPTESLEVMANVEGAISAALNGS